MACSWSSQRAFRERLLPPGAAEVVSRSPGGVGATLGTRGTFNPPSPWQRHREWLCTRLERRISLSLGRPPVRGCHLKNNNNSNDSDNKN